MFSKHVYTLIIVTIYAYASASDQRHKVLQEALERGEVSPCTIATEIHEKYGPLFELAVQKCNEPVHLSRIAGLDNCGVSCLRALHKKSVDLDVLDAYPDHKHLGTPLTRTPLYCAVVSGNIEKAAYLVDHGADVFKKSVNTITRVRRGTPIDCAIYRIGKEGRLNIANQSYVPNVAMLCVLQRGTKVNILDPTRYGFYEKYTRLLLDPPQCNDIDFNGISRADALYECTYPERKHQCVSLHVCQQMYEALKKAEEEHFGNNKKE